MPRCSTAALLAVSVAGVVRPACGIRCWGANAAAMQRARGAAASCTAGADRFDLFRYDNRREPCFEECGGVTWFEGHSTGGKHFANPTGKRLCPGVVDKDECNCEAWPTALTPDNSCPRCDDYETLPPLIRTRNTPTASRSAWAKLEECPDDHDTCVEYCFHEPKFKGAGTWCFFGCAKASSKPAIELAVATQLSSLTYQQQWKNIGSIYAEFQPPNTMTCDIDTHDCHLKFCTEDACNKGPGYTFKYISNRFWRHWPPLILLSIVLIMILVFGIVPAVTEFVRVRVLGYPPAAPNKRKRK